MLQRSGSAVWFLRQCRYARDPSLRLKNGSVRDDARLKRCWRPRCLPLALAIVFVCQCSVAQAGHDDWANVQNLPADLAVIVKVQSGTKYHGELVSVTPDSLALDSDEPAFPGRTIRRREIKREDIREIRLTAPAASMLAGAAIGAGVGVGVGVGLDASAKSHEDRGLLALLMGGLGATIGVAVARHHGLVKGRLIYAAR